jgi:hypothetical protein
MQQHIRFLLVAGALASSMCTPDGGIPPFSSDSGLHPDVTHDASTPPTTEGDGSTDKPPRPDVGECSPIGTNLPMPAYWTASFPFVDAMKPTFRFISGSADQWNDHRSLDLDEQGWLRSLQPGQIARVFVVDTSDIPGRPTGRYTVLYDGQGTMDYHGSVQNLRRDVGRDTFDSTGGFFINITQVDATNPIRNIRVLLPGGSCDGDHYAYCQSDGDCGGARCVPFEETQHEQPFHPQFLEEVKPFRALRFMDWMETNREAAQTYPEHRRSARHYDDYPTREAKSWRPVPIDVMIDLANELGADAWFNIPHAAEDELVRRMAARVAERLRPDLKVYIEYTNEAWNTIFQQHHWINAQGCREESPNPRAECDGNGNGELCEYGDWGVHGRCVRYGERWFARRTVEVGRIWQEAFGSDGADRVVRVMGVQVGGNWWFERVLRETLPNGDPVHQHLDAIATAPYFFMRGDVSTVDDVFGRNGAPDGDYRVLYGDPADDNDSAMDWVIRDMAVLDAPDLRHLDLLAYEAGQGLFSTDRARAAHFLEANSDPRMAEVYRDYLERWARYTGGSLMMHFAAATSAGWYGSWGHKEYQGQPRQDAPKYDALLGYIEDKLGCGDPRMW